MNPMTSQWLRRAFLPAPEVFLFVLIFFLSLAFMPDMLNSDGDLGRHLTVGNYILDTRAVPLRDVFSHTRFDAPLVLHEWLSEAAYALAFRAAGLNGAAWLTAFLLAALYFVLAAGLRAVGVSAPLAFLAALAAYFTAMLHHLPRPHLFSLLCFTTLLVLCELYRKTDKKFWLALFVPVMVLWANFNGAFVLAFFVLGIYAMGAAFERLPQRALIFLGLLGVSFLAALVNPFGIALPQHVFGFMGNRFLVDNTVEYLSPNFHGANTWLFAAWILFSILLLGRNTTRVAWTEIFLLGAWTAFGLYSARNIPLYAQVAALTLFPVAERLLVTRLPALRARLENMNAVAPVASGWTWLVILPALLIFLQAQGARFDVRGSGNVFNNATFPVRAVDFLQRQPPQGNMFNEYTWGGYLEYRLFPSQRVFIDGDNDFFGEALVREYLDAINARQDWQGILQKYKVQWVIVPPTRPLAQALAQSDAWREIFRDETAVVFVSK